jgi:hypothetical protein
MRLLFEGSFSFYAGEFFHYTPGRDRQALHKLEMDVNIPPSSKVILSFMVEKGHLKWDEYPPDANHGFYLPAAHFEVNITKENKKIETRHYYSRILLVNLSTPDFSMPYNVICLTCTVVALAFGPIHNITTKRLQLKLIPPRGHKLKQLWGKIWRRNETKPAEENSAAEETTNNIKPSTSNETDASTQQESQPQKTVITNNDSSERSSNGNGSLSSDEE